MPPTSPPDDDPAAKPEDTPAAKSDGGSAAKSDPPTRTAPRRSAALLAAVIAVPIAVVAGVAVFLINGANSPAPTASASASAGATDARGDVVVSAPAPLSAAKIRACGTLLGKLPITLDGQHSRPVSEAPQRVVAWGSPPVILRCGVAPVSPAPDAQLLQINGVTWFGRPGGVKGANIVFTSTDRAIPIEITVPARTQQPSAPVAELSKPVGTTIQTSS